MKNLTPLFRQFAEATLFESTRKKMLWIFIRFEVLYKEIHARKRARSPVPRGGRPRWSVPCTQRRRMKRSCYRWKRKERPGHLKSTLTLRCFFPSPSPSLTLVLRCPTFPRWRGQVFRTIVELFVDAAAQSDNYCKIFNDVAVVGGHFA